MNGMGPAGPVQLLLERLEGVREQGGFYRALCPAHDDRNTPNLDIKEGDDGRALLVCRAGCETEDVVEALGLRMKDLFVPNGHGNGGVDNAAPRSCTLEAYATAKKLPAEYLNNLGLSDISYYGSPALRIPYRGPDGDEVAVRFRLRLEKGTSGDERFRWRKGSRPTLYGLWRIERSKEAGYVVLVEGESDCHTLWRHGVEALGIPGASNWKEEWSAYLDGVEKVYAIVEPDDGGTAFWERLTASPLRERLYRVELDDAKDASDLHLRDPDRFKEDLRAAFREAVRWTDQIRKEADVRAREAWASCKNLARHDRILDTFADALRRSGVAGESCVAKLLYLAVTSRFLTRPVSVAVKGPSSGGKSYLTESVLRFFPEDAYHALTAMSERTLAYSEEPIKHRFLVVYEAAGMSGEFATYLMRSLLSEGRVRYETVEKTPQGLKARLIEREGPTGLIVTTTAVKLHPENETRLLSLTVADTQEQTRGVLAAMAEEERAEVSLKSWLALQDWLGSPAVERRVTIPYARDLARLVPPVAVRLRRDFAAVLNLIRTHAILHQASRERDPQGRIVATLEDYSAVRDLVEDLVSEGIGATVSETVRETVAAVARLREESRGEPVTVTALAAELDLDRSAASRRARSAREQGYLRDLEDNPRKPSRLVPGDPLPEDLQILPEPEALKACKRAGVIGGIDTPLSRQNGAADGSEGGGGGAYPSSTRARLHASGDEDGYVEFTV